MLSDNLPGWVVSQGEPEPGREPRESPRGAGLAPNLAPELPQPTALAPAGRVIQALSALLACCVWEFWEQGPEDSATEAGSWEEGRTGGTEASRWEASAQTTGNDLQSYKCFLCAGLFRVFSVITVISVGKARTIAIPRRLFPEFLCTRSGGHSSEGLREESRKALGLAECPEVLSSPGAATTAGGARWLTPQHMPFWLGPSKVPEGFQGGPSKLLSALETSASSCDFRSQPLGQAFAGPTSPPAAAIPRAPAHPCSLLNEVQDGANGAYMAPMESNTTINA